MKVTDEMIKKLSEMAKIKVSKNFIKEDLKKITQWVDIINELNIEETEELKNMSLMNNVLREDIITEPLPSQEEILRNATSKNSNYYKIPSESLK